MDPEIQDLLDQTRRLVGIAYRLNVDLTSTLDALDGFVGKYDRRQEQLPFPGEDRRSD